MKKNFSKLLALYLPYLLLGLAATNFGEAWRLAEGKEMGDKILSLMSTIPAAFANPLPSLHPLDILVGICCGAGLRLAVYLKSKDAAPALRFASMRYLEKQNIAPSIENYEILYRGNLPTGKRNVPQPELLEQLYQKFNCAQPMDYHGHSLSVSDVILLNQARKISAHYVDSIGFRELSGFQDKQERSSVLSQLKAKCDMPECNPTKCRKGRNDHAI